MKFGNRKERITGAEILPGQITNSDVASGAAIAGSKISPDVTNAVIGAASGYKIARGSVSVTGSTTVDAGVTVTAVVASLESIGTGAGNPFVVTAKPATSGSTSKIVLSVYQDSGAAATTAGTVNWIVVGS